MKRKDGIRIAEKIRARGFSLSGWARANGFSIRTVNDFLYARLGEKRGGPMTRKIEEALRRDGFWPEQRSGEKKR